MVNIIKEGAVQYLTQGPSVSLREWPKNKKKAFWPGDGWQYLHTMCICTLVHGGAHKQPGLLPCLTVAIGYETAPTSSRRPARTKRLLCLVVICGNLFLLALSLSVSFSLFCVGRAMLFE